MVRDPVHKLHCKLNSWGPFAHLQRWKQSEGSARSGSLRASQHAGVKPGVGPLVSRFPKQTLPRVFAWSIMHGVSVCWDYSAKCSTLSGLNVRNFLFAVLEVRSFRPRGQQGWFLLRAVREGPASGLSPWLVGGRLLLVSSHGEPFVLDCVQI